ncbi:MAG: cytochrome c biogenesis CcdA family protein [Actinomycetaceae bacterium]|nr:cytochrome c biogenesis CcdA family protein [Actinomycetaceae bacterium]
MPISYATAYIGGLVTILAPCAAMLIPAFFAYAFTSRTKLVSRTLIFFLGLSCALIPLGLAAGSVGSLLSQHRSQVSLIAGIIIVILGIILAFSLPFPHLRLPSRKRTSGRSAEDNAATPLAVFLLGVSYGLAGAGCTGPILGATLVVASHTGSAFQGGTVMAFYSFGMVTPVALLALLWDTFDIGSKRFLRPRPIRLFGQDTTVGSIISGVLFILLGLGLIITGGLTDFSILDAFEQQHLETRIMEALNSIPNWIFIVLLTAVVALTVLALSGKKKDQ